MYQYQLVVFWEAAFGFSEFFFGDSCNAFAHFMMGDLWAFLPTLCWVFTSFWTKMAWPPCPTLPIHPISLWVIFFPPDEKMSSKGNILLMWKRWNKKWQSVKGIKKIDEFKKLLWVVEKSLGVLHQMEITLKVTEVLKCEGKPTVFNKYSKFWGPPHIAHSEL